MFQLIPIIVLNFLCIGFRFAFANSACPSTSVSECVEVLKNVYEDERIIRAWLPDISEKLAQKDCENSDKNDDMKFTDCAKLQKSGINKSGVYTIYPKSSSNDKKLKVYCDMETDGGGWIVVQRRAEYPGMQINFTRRWDEYRDGFGNLSQEFWLGNKNIHLLTAQEEVELRVDLKDFEGASRYAEYDTMLVMDESWNYFLMLGNYSGDAGDGLALHNKTEFYTYDKDDSIKCATTYKGGWWYNHCHRANLNGVYMRGNHYGSIGITWYPWHGSDYSLKHTEMKLRPRHLHDET